ncbi:MAG TPA: tetratricopeptide repeat protein [Pyrinomonadaceae bacterium]|jgi:tetratricopeptide (TPR) repeat protein/TolB-like protein|nr:tetratricopeptide repeat protein [Pyrinomonadaceae bacterium]
MFRLLAAFALVALLSLAPTAGLSASAAPAPQAAGDVVLVLPFENTSSQREFNWVGESFADSLADLLGAHGLKVVSSDARELAYQRLRLPLSVLPSRATAIKLAQQAGATLVVQGTYEVTPAPDDKTIAKLVGSARMVRVNEGRIAGKSMADGRWATHEFFFGDALVNLQSVQGKLAYQILYEQDDKLPFSMISVVEQATKVPPKAFEGLVKATMTDDPEKKEAYLTNAMREFERANPGSVYKQAAFELGHLNFQKRERKKAAEFFSMLQPRDPHYAEAAFYAALSYWHLGETQSALDVLMPLVTTTPLTSIYNNLGAVATQAARFEKNEARRESLVKQATGVLSRAADSAPDDPMVRFNYGYALMLAGKHAEAAEQFGEVVKINPRDPQAVFLLAKMQEKVGQTEPAAANDNEARKIYQEYAKAQTEWMQSQTASLIGVRMRGDFNRADLIAQQGEADRTKEVVETASAQGLLSRARESYEAGRDDDALSDLRNVVRIEPNNAEAYLLTGRIYQRRGELVPAINQLKTSIFWDTDRKLIDAHILLGRIFLERGDRAQATAYAHSAMQIDPNNQEAIALQRQLQVGIR